MREYSEQVTYVLQVKDIKISQGIFMNNETGCYRYRARPRFLVTLRMSTED